METICVTCKNKYTKRFYNQLYCKKACRPELHHSDYKAKGISTGTVGAMSELRVSADLMSKGYEVYRALSQSSSCDVLAMKNGKVFTFEIRTGHTNDVTEKVYYAKENLRAERFAVFVPHTGKILYVPDLSI